MNSSKAVHQKLMGLLPSMDDFLSMEEYSTLYTKMIKTQTDASGNDLPQKKQLEDSHHDIRGNLIKQKINILKNQRRKK